MGITKGDSMLEITRKNWDNLMERSVAQPIFLYLETPLCGTCKMGKKMFTVAAETANSQLDNPVEAATCNINGIPELAERYGVTSVPCLLVLSRGIAQKKIYALQSASFIYNTMMEIMEKGQEK
jgi:thioredoxin-like negative regulator of GroEL